MESEALISVPEAAKLLGVHPNTIRNRIKAGQYTAEWTQSSHGPKQLIPRDQVLGVSMPTNGEVPSHGLAFIEVPPSNLEANLQHVLAPFLERLEATLVEVGTLRESKRQLEASNQTLVTEVQRLEAERLDRQRELERLQSLVETTRAPEPKPRSWWQRLFAQPAPS
jgi:hypothetical protein